MREGERGTEKEKHEQERGRREKKREERERRGRKIGGREKREGGREKGDETQIDSDSAGEGKKRRGEIDLLSDLTSTYSSLSVFSAHFLSE